MYCRAKHRLVLKQLMMGKTTLVSVQYADVKNAIFVTKYYFLALALLEEVSSKVNLHFFNQGPLKGQSNEIFDPQFFFIIRTGLGHGRLLELHVIL